MVKLYVGNLPYHISDRELADLFSKYGRVQSASVIVDKFSGKSKGFGFVELDSDEEAQRAIKDLNGKEMDNRTINVSIARPKEERSPREGRFRERRY